MPLIAIYDPATLEVVFFQDKTLDSHFKNHWKFTSDGFELKNPNTLNDGLKFEPMDSHAHLHEALYQA